MLFTEPSFLFLFLPVLVVLYFLTPQRDRNLLLTAASLLFYSVGEWKFLPWLLGSTALNYCVALGLDVGRGRRWQRPLLLLGITTDLSLLLYFKYAGFLVANWNTAAHALGRAPVSLGTVALPLGISFFTFHKISYKVDVYRGTAVVRRNPLDLLLYILLFPQLIAGPIIRYHDIADELFRRKISSADFSEGVRRFVLGLAKKMLIANTVALAADRIFNLSAADRSGSIAWLGIACYTLQIYFDFSGYSDMAIGLGRMFGFHFLENFNYPYASRSITEFWRRWHISLSRWFRDYLYIPLGGNRVAPGRLYFNLALVFFLCGLWHGASWNFVVWGLLHGALLVIERWGLERAVLAMPRALQHVYVLVAVMVGWVFFRAATLTDALTFLRSMLGAGTFVNAQYSLASFLDLRLVVALVAGCVCAGPTWAWLNQPRPAPIALGRAVLGHVALLGLFLLSAMQIASGTYNPFIYFRF